MATPKRGTRKLSDVARHVVRPSGITATGWGPVRDACRVKLGVTFDRWQDGAGRLVLAEREDGKLAAMVGGVGMSLPRQVGKTYLLAGLIFGLCITKPGLLVIWSAHHARTHGETFLAMQAFADRAKVKPYISQIYTGSGDEEIRFHNGSRILFGARERGFGRGIPGVDVLVMDEAQILSDKALENMLATLNTSSFGLQLYIGTPPKPEDNSEAFERMRSEALEAPGGLSEDSVWIECGADPDASPDDRKQWAKANPSYPHRTPAESILRLRKKLKLDGFLREGLGIWQEGRATSILPGWPSLATERPDSEVSAIGLAVSLDGEWGSIAQADVYGDGMVNLASQERRQGSAWLVGEAKRIQEQYGCMVGIDQKCQDATLIGDLIDAGVSLVMSGEGKARKPGMSLENYVEASSELENRVRERTVTHQGDPDMDNAVAAASWRSVGDGRTVPGRKASSGHIDMLEAAIAAEWAALRNNYDSLDSTL